MLKVISSSPGELEPVFEAMLENADADLRSRIRQFIYRCDDNDLYVIAARNATCRPYAERLRSNGSQFGPQVR